MLTHTYMALNTYTPTDATETLFVYGSLKQPMVQVQIIGRYDVGQPDILCGYDTHVCNFGKQTYPMIRPDHEGIVTGVRIALTPDELALLDHYETEAYTRIRVTLRSGHTTWVYADANQA